jgi:hypothetical protein
MIIIGGARPTLVHRPDECQFRDDDDMQIEGVPEFFRSWPESDVLGWDKAQPTRLGRDANDGGCWTGGEFHANHSTLAHHARDTNCSAVETNSADMFPFIGSVPNREGQWMAAGFAGHGKHVHLNSVWCAKLMIAGMPRILLSTAHIIPGVLDSLGFEHQQPALAAPYPSLPKPFRITAERIARLQDTDLTERAQAHRERCKESSVKPFCRDERSLMWNVGTAVAISV